METTSIAAHLRVVLARAARRLRQEAGGDLSPSQTAALATIERRGPLTPSELAAYERIQRPTARSSSAPPTSSSGCWRTNERGAAPLARLALGPQLPPLLRRPGRLPRR